MSNTIICLNQDCLTVNSINNKFCEKCGEKILLRERYQAVKLIGQGGFGRTFLAKDLDKPSKPYCVIKQFFPSAQGTNNIAKASELFAQEAERLEQLGKHPQIPELFAYFVTDDGRQYLVQEYIAGENLQSELENHGVYKESEVKELLIEILNILKFVHENQVIHRDIKPDNIIRRNSDQKLVLVDFGAAKYISSPSALNVTGTVIGAAQYCSPEQARGKPIFASDLYSLGVVCIHLLTLVDPFELFDISEHDWVWRDYLVNNPVSEKFGKVLDQLITQGLKKRFGKVDQILKALNYQHLSPTKPESNKQDVQKAISLTPAQKVSHVTNKNTPKIETVQFTTTTIIIVKKGLFRQEKEVVTQNRKGTCQIAKFDLGNGVNLEMVKIPAGEFMMGARRREKGASNNEYPQHKVVIAKPFYMGKYPITQAQYQAIMGYNPAHFKEDKRPVEKVSWNMAQEFCQKLSNITSKKFSLPSESQWEYACRAGTITQFYCGETITTDLANYNGHYIYGDGYKGINRGKTNIVGDFPPNAFGLYDMHGNVWELCEDSWHDNYYVAPNNSNAWVINSQDHNKKLIRGGSWYDNPTHCRVTFRGIKHRKDTSKNIGFRVICEII